MTVKRDRDRRPLKFVRFTHPIVLEGTNIPVTTLDSGQRKTGWAPDYTLPPMFLDYDRDEVLIGPHTFPRNGGLVAEYRFARAAAGAHVE